MGQRGKKRKDHAQRTSSGRISRSQAAQDGMREHEERDAQKVVVLRRVRDKLRHDVTHPWFGFPLGQLALEEYITAEELDAGRAWAELTWRHAQMIGLMLPKCKAIDWEGSQGRSLSKPPDEEKIEQIKERKNDADNRIRQAGFGAMREMMRVCACDEEPSDRVLLRRALQKLLDK
ncbi:MAG: hypothetical protein Q8R92_18835, partial [Deltaproteobacteria bacterium]|nr:hypothetical protein [Deltaproteobacteria bacterium]